jgi:hypothetical protein
LEKTHEAKKTKYEELANEVDPIELATFLLPAASRADFARHKGADNIIRVGTVGRTRVPMAVLYAAYSPI